jgi:multicomponent Na+:H+ antiporter subunit G
VTAAFLALLVLATWLGAAGFARQRNALDRIHALTFVTVTSGPLVLLAVLAHEGFSDSTLKILFLVVCALLNGAALSHASGRALWYRNRTEHDA